MSCINKIQSSVNLLLVSVFLFANFFFYPSANTAFSAETNFQSSLLIHDEDQSITGDLFDLNQFSENISAIQIIKQNTFSNTQLDFIIEEFERQDLEILINTKFTIVSKRAEVKIYLAIHALKIP